jgi:RimJ/RimL family protein N-acetyltransferase
MSFPAELRTTRLFLRPWRAADADALRPILEANRAHLGPWIPARVAEPVPVPELARRLADFGANFAADREWRLAMLSRDGREIFGEVGLFPRDATGRVPFAHADRAELGYWLRSDATGQGIVTEAARAVLGVAAAMPAFSRIEIRCDGRNGPSVAVARRLGFHLAAPIAADAEQGAGSTEHSQTWISELL